MPTVLFVAHAFPPATGSGPIRLVKFTRYLPSFGWRPVVLTLDRSQVARPDATLEAEIPPGLLLYRARSLKRASIPPSPSSTGPSVKANQGGPLASRLTRGLKGQAAHVLQFPDRHNTWLPGAIRQGLRVLRQHRVDLLYSSAAPFTNHVVSLALHRATGVPLVIELRDGWQRWNEAIYRDYPFWRGVLEHRLEQATFRHAARIVLVTEQSASAFRAQYATLPPERFVVVPNGYDRLDFERENGEVPRSQPDDGAQFTIAHTGSLYYGRSIAQFLEAVARVAESCQGFKDRARVQLIGDVDEAADAEITAAVSRHHLDRLIERRAYMSHAQVAPILLRAAALLLIVNNTPGGGTAVPGKLYEYLAARRPVLCIAPRGAEAAEIVRRASAGPVVGSGNVSGLEHALRSLFERWAAGQLMPTHREEEIVRYGRVQLTARLASVFNDALDTSSCCRPRGAWRAHAGD